ncbi:unnamed protein product [Caenorhabditis bovis]|uniref:Uncharacterized protein n=1 Tax=Caenorhabditis bovis TaxID=2654633 RepID=A0A8S1F886_9PELO|nr:unnamed protein product [Caenorhabditis bovis]
MLIHGLQRGTNIKQSAVLTQLDTPIGRLHSRDMLSFVHALILALLCSIVFVEAMPSVRFRPAKKAMRNSLVRFGKRAGPMTSEDVFLGESYGPVPESFEYVPENSRSPSVLFY